MKLQSTQKLHTARNIQISSVHPGQDSGKISQPQVLEASEYPITTSTHLHQTDPCTDSDQYQPKCCVEAQSLQRYAQAGRMCRQCSFHVQAFHTNTYQSLFRVPVIQVQPQEEMHNDSKMRRVTAMKSQERPVQLIHIPTRSAPCTFSDTVDSLSLFCLTVFRVAFGHLYEFC